MDLRAALELVVDLRNFVRPRDDLARAHPEWARERLDAEASTSHHQRWAGCGGAVDVSLIENGRELDLGSRLNATPAESANACFTDAENISAVARDRRQMLGAALTAAGLSTTRPSGGAGPTATATGRSSRGLTTRCTVRSDPPGRSPRR